MKATQRVFFALWPDESVRQIMSEVQKNYRTNGQLMRPANLHLTLVFIGQIDLAKLSCIRKTASEIHAEPFDLNIDQLGSFGRKALWLGCNHAPDGLFQLQHDLQSNLQSHCGYRPEKRPFSPHITLSRKIRQPLSAQLETPFSWDVRSFSLIRSEFSNTGVTYSEIDRWDFRR